MKKNTVKIIMFTFVLQLLLISFGYAAVYSDKPLSELNYWLSVAGPGDTIKIADGEYDSLSITISASGTYENPVVIKPANAGGVVITGDSHIKITGKYIELSGFYFKSANAITSGDLISIKKGEGIRITGCYFEESGGGGASGRIISITDNSNNNRIDHNTFYDSKSIGIGIYAYDDPDGILSNVSGNKIDHNYFKKVRPVKEVYPDSSNGMECMQTGVGGRLPLYTEVSYNLFEDCTGDGAEVISNKSSFNTYKFNTFLNNPDSTFCLRGGDNNIVYGNYFINMKDGVRAYGEGNIIANNYFYLIRRNSIVLSSCDGENYQTPKNYLVANNTIINPYYAGISIGEKMDDASINSPENVRVVNNYIVSDKGMAIINKNGKNITFENNIQRLNSGAKSDISPFEKEEYKFKRTIRTGNGSITLRTLSSYYDSSFNGEIFTPVFETALKGKGADLPELHTIDLNLETPLDIGVNNLSGNLQIVTADNTGPENKWWLEKMEDLPFDYRKYEPETSADSYTPFSENIYLEKGESINLYSISGYADYSGELFNIDRKGLTFKLSKNDVASLDKNILTALGTGTVYMDVAYKGITKKVKVNIRDTNIPLSDDFKEGTDNLYKISGTMLLNDGGINLKAGANVIHTNSFYKDSYLVTAIVKGDGARILAGFNNSISYGDLKGYNINRSYYYAELGGQNQGIYRYNGITNLKIGDIKGEFSSGTLYDFTLKIIKNKIIAFVDGELSGIALADENINGMVGMGSGSGEVLINSFEAAASDFCETEPDEFTLSLQPTDVSEISFVPDDYSDIFLVRLERNGMWLKDFLNNEQIKDVNAISGNTYSYKLTGFDKEGNEKCFKEISYTFDKIPDDVFNVSSILVKCGEGDTYIDGVYKWIKDGIDVGKPAFLGRTYPYSELPEELKGNSYIAAEYQHRLITKAQTAQEWLKFDIENKSVDIYLIIYSDTPPDWILNNGWEKTSMKVQAQTGAERFEEGYIYKKHFDCSSGEKQTVTLGGFGAGTPYGIIFNINNSQ